MALRLALVVHTRLESTRTTLGRPVRSDVFLSYAREDSGFVADVVAALEARGTTVWVDVEDIRAGASDWRAAVWTAIEGAGVVVPVLTPALLDSTVCGEELERAVELNKRIVVLLRHPVDAMDVPPAIDRPNWIDARDGADADAALDALVAAIETDEAWVDEHARLTQRTLEWLRRGRDASHLLRGSDLAAAERWLDEEAGHAERATADQVAYITAGRRAAARRQRILLSAVTLALGLTVGLAVVALVQRSKAVDRERTARAQANAAQAIAALARDPEESIQRALEAVSIRRNDPEALYALRRAVAGSRWTAILRMSRRGRGGAAPLLDADFSPDGRLVATAADDGGVAMWRLRDRRGMALAGHRTRVNTLVFSPDSSRLLTASADGTARTWDAHSGRPVHVLRTGASDVWAATYGAGGRVVATVSARGAQLWDARSGRALGRLPRAGEYRGTIRLSADGERVLTPGGAGGDGWLWSFASGRRIATLPGDGREALRFALFSGDDRRILTIDDGGDAAVWASADGRRIARLPRLARSGTAITDADFDVHGRRVLVAGDGDAEVRDVGTGDRVARLRKSGAVVSAQFDRSGRYVVTADTQGVARVWRVSDGKVAMELRGHTAGIHRARFSADGRRVLTASDDGSARVWPSRPHSPDSPGWQRADSATFGPDSRHVLIVDGDRRAVWDTQRGVVVALRGGINPADQWPCGRAAGCSPWSPDGRLVAGADAAGRAVVWDARTGAVRRRIGPDSGYILGAAFSSDGRRVAVVDGEARRAATWDLAGGRRQTSMPRHAGDVLQSAQFLDDPVRVLTVDAEGAAVVSDAATGVGNRLPGDTQPQAVATSRDGKRLAIGTIDGVLRVFAGAASRPRDVRATAGGSVNSVAFDPSGTAIATGGQKGTTTIWDARTLEATTLQAPGGAITGATFSTDGRVVLTTSGMVARLWDRGLRRELADLPRAKAIAAELSPDSRKIVLAGASRLEVLACDACVPPAELERRARGRLPIEISARARTSP